jgi:hypothetical protein
MKEDSNRRPDYLFLDYPNPQLSRRKDLYGVVLVTLILVGTIGEIIAVLELFLCW